MKSVLARTSVIRMLVVAVLLYPLLAQKCWAEGTVTVTPQQQPITAGHNIYMDFRVTYSPAPADMTGFTFMIHSSNSDILFHQYCGLITVSTVGSVSVASATLHVAVDVSTPPGDYSAEIEALVLPSDKKGAITTLGTAPVSLTVHRFTMSAIPATATVVRRNSVDFLIDFRMESDFSVSLYPIVTGLPKNTTAQFDPQTVNCTYPAGCSATLRITTKSNAPRGTYTLSVMPYNYSQRARPVLIIK